MLEGWEQVRELRQELKTEWGELWRTKYDEYATKDFKPLSFRDILEKHIGSDVATKAYPDPAVGGWRKFVKEHLRRHKSVKKRERPKVKVDLSQQQRKSGCGWLNRARIWKKIRQSGYAD